MDEVCIAEQVGFSASLCSEMGDRSERYSVRQWTTSRLKAQEPA